MSSTETPMHQPDITPWNEEEDNSEVLSLPNPRHRTDTIAMMAASGSDPETAAGNDAAQEREVPANAREDIGPELDFLADDLLADAAAATPETEPSAPSTQNAAGSRGSRKPQGSAIQLIVDLAAKRELGSALRSAIRGGHPVVVVILVPSASWIEPMRKHIERVAGSQRIEVIKAATRPKPGTHEDDACHRIAAGVPVIAIATAIDHLAPLLAAAADHRLVLPPPDAELVAIAIRRWCRRGPRVALSVEDLSGLDLRDVAAALRPRSTPALCLERLRRAREFRNGTSEAPVVAPLQALSGYGAAQTWALGLVADIAAVRRGELAANALEGAVFYGLPGTGKTMLAQAIAVAAEVPYQATSVADWFSSSTGYLDGVIKQVDSFCDLLLLSAKCAGGTAIGFLDELDALPNRATLSARGSDWWTPVITHCLMRFEAVRRSGIVLLAATNHLTKVDAALLRPGRLDRQFLIPPPDAAGRLGILRTHLGADLRQCDLERAVLLSQGATGAVLAGHVRGARRRARLAERPLDLDDLLAEIAPPDERSVAELRGVALHEASHAVIAHRLGLTLLQVTTRASGLASGTTLIRFDDPMPDRRALERRVIALLAGRAADVEMGRGAHTGAVADLQEATRMLSAIHASFGLGAVLSHRSGPERADLLLAQDSRLAGRVEADLQRLMRHAISLVRDNAGVIRAVVAALLAQETLRGEQVAAIAFAHRRRVSRERGRSPAEGIDGEAPCSPT